MIKVLNETDKELTNRLNWIKTYKDESYETYEKKHQELTEFKFLDSAYVYIKNILRRILMKNIYLKKEK